MTPITVHLSDEQAIELNERAKRAGVTAEDLASAGLQDWLRQSRAEAKQTRKRRRSAASIL